MSTQSRQNFLLAFATLAVVGFALYFFFPKSEIVLSKPGYDITLALFRTCNQSSDIEVARIEQLVQRMRNQLQAEEVSAIESILAFAKDGQWKTADLACRQLLEAQISRQ
ncbi:hypothetical protein LOC67_25805 [Stieleria sp. JC731]|uniref:hypothetical protein n=1 Tax=Pirellulaceae TaxID=2691357 RepID=UPI001E515D5C|nr:hypothetical protein [Stieleria sp. JC731]MCC9603982.1 hypothetical protein [Stieleria sp. JC731]